MSGNNELKDLIYFDFSKAASLLSQIEGGLTQEITSGVDGSTDQRNIRTYDLKFFKGEFGGVSTEKVSQIETRVLHDYLLVRTETLLSDRNMLLDINSIVTSQQTTTTNVRDLLSADKYLRAEGWAKIEDYTKLKGISKNFNLISDFINKCSMNSIENSQEFKTLSSQIEDEKKTAKEIKDRNERARYIQEINLKEKLLLNSLKEAASLQNLPTWLLEGINDWIDIFMPGRILIRVFPFDQFPEFQVLANLKRECFVDGDLENLLLSYGTRPDVKLTIFGLISSLPEENGYIFDPMSEFKNVPSLNDEVAFEKAFRDIFASFEGFEGFTKFSRFPNVTVFPIAIYRKIK